MFLFIPSGVFASIGNFFSGVALLVALLAGLTLWQFRPRREAGPAAARPPRLSRLYAVLMGAAIGAALLIAGWVYSLAQ